MSINLTFRFVAPSGLGGLKGDFSVFLWGHGFQASLAADAAALAPIAAITQDISGLGGLDSVSVDPRTIWNAAWLTSLLKRFHLVDICSLPR